MHNKYTIYAKLIFKKNDRRIPEIDEVIYKLSEITRVRGIIKRTPTGVMNLLLFRKLDKGFSVKSI